MRRTGRTSEAPSQQNRERNLKRSAHGLEVLHHLLILVHLRLLGHVAAAVVAQVVRNDVHVFEGLQTDSSAVRRTSPAERRSEESGIMLRSRQ